MKILKNLNLWPVSRPIEELVVEWCKATDLHAPVFDSSTPSLPNASSVA